MQVKWVKVTPEDRIRSVMDGTIDIECGSTTHTLSRQQQVDFTLMTFADGASILTTSASGIRRVTDLGGKKIAVAPGTTTEPALAARTPAGRHQRPDRHGQGARRGPRAPGQWRRRRIRLGPRHPDRARACLGQSAGLPARRRVPVRPAVRLHGEARRRGIPAGRRPGARTATARESLPRSIRPGSARSALQASCSRPVIRTRRAT